jgi:hypothetical protein
MIKIVRGDVQAALDFPQQVPPGVWQDTVLVLARQVGTDRAAADAALKTLIDRDTDRSSYQIAQVYALRLMRTMPSSGSTVPGATGTWASASSPRSLSLGATGKMRASLPSAARSACPYRRRQCSPHESATAVRN